MKKVVIKILHFEHYFSCLLSISLSTDSGLYNVYLNESEKICSKLARNVFYKLKTVTVPLEARSVTNAE